MNRDFSRPPSRPIQDLPVKEAYRQAVFEIRINPMRALTFPFALSVLIKLISTDLALWIITFLPWREVHDHFLAFEYIVDALLLTLPITIFGIAWYRTILLRVKTPMIPRWERCHWQFLGYLVAAALIILVVPAIVLLALGPAAFSVSLAIAVYVLLRSSFVFPAVAVHEEYGVRHSWAHTRGQILRLLAVLALVCVPIVAVFYVIQVTLMFLTGWLLVAILGEGILGYLSILGYNASILIAPYAACASGMVVTAIAFQSCTGWHPANRFPSGTQEPKDGHDRKNGQADALSPAPFAVAAPRNHIGKYRKRTRLKRFNHPQELQHVGPPLASFVVGDEGLQLAEPTPQGLRAVCVGRRITSEKSNIEKTSIIAGGRAK